MYKNKTMKSIVETISYMITGHYSEQYQKELKPYILITLASFTLVFMIKAVKVIALLQA